MAMTDTTRKYTSLAALQVLGEGLRRARSGGSPPLRLADIGDDPEAPRTWSHSHLSKIERGKEVPSIELVLWYERRTNAPTHSLVSLWEQATGQSYVPPSHRSAEVSSWSIERLEMALDLRDEQPLLTHTRDLIALTGGDTYWILYDTKDVSVVAGQSDVAAVLGGTIVERMAVENATVEKARIDLGRFVAQGEWHRLRVEHRLPTRDIAPYLDFSLRSASVREVQLMVTLPAGPRPRVLRFTHAYAAELTELLASPFSIASAEPARETIEPDAQGVVMTRFLFPVPGFHHGIVWQW